MTRPAAAVSVRVWQHVPDGSGGCVRCGGPAQIMGRMGCTPGPARTLQACPGGFTSASVPCDCNGDNPSHRPIPVAEADFSHYRDAEPGTTTHNGQRLQVLPASLDWRAIAAAMDVDDDELGDDGRRW